MDIEKDTYIVNKRQIDLFEQKGSRELWLYIVYKNICIYIIAV